MFEDAPPGLDERVGKRDLRPGQKTLQDARPDQLIDRSIEVFNTSIDEQRGLSVGQMPQGVDEEFSCCARVELGGYLPGENATREVVDDSMKVGSASTREGGSTSYPHAKSRWDGRHECRLSVWRDEYACEVAASRESGSAGTR